MKFFVMLNLFLISPMLFSDSSYNPTCKAIFKEVNFNYHIKSVKGWVRVCNNHKMHKYIDGDEEYEYILCNCIKIHYTDIKKSNKGIFYEK